MKTLLARHETFPGSISRFNLYHKAINVFDIENTRRRNMIAYISMQCHRCLQMPQSITDCSKRVRCSRQPWRRRDEGEGGGGALELLSVTLQCAGVDILLVELTLHIVWRRDVKNRGHCITTLCIV